MNPWETISLDVYEKHMSLDSVRQLQALNELVKIQLDKYPVATAMIFGVAGGNGLEHVDVKKYRKVYGIDINEEYLSAVKERFSELGDTLECRKIDLVNETDKLPESELIIADLFVEYVGYEAFQRSVLQAKARYVSCIIQINSDAAAWVSDSPYLHAFDSLDEVHHQMDEKALTEAMNVIGYKLSDKSECALPNGKSFVMLDYEAMVLR